MEDGKGGCSTGGKSGDSREWYAYTRCVGDCEWRLRGRIRWECRGVVRNLDECGGWTINNELSEEDEDGCGTGGGRGQERNNEEGHRQYRIPPRGRASRAQP